MQLASNTSIVLLCRCGGGLVQAESFGALTIALKNASIPFLILEDLCGCAVSQREALSSLFTSVSGITLVACHRRAVDLLLLRCNINPETLSLEVLNYREKSTVQIGEELIRKREQFINPADFLAQDIIVRSEGLIHLKSDPEWPAWYPLIDPVRCTHCGQCADFCLFGVYEKLPGQVRVVHPAGCKNNCPACARICPHTAIAFPKYELGGAISGADTIDELQEQQRQQHDIESILGGNIYQALERRKARRQSIIRSEAMKKAEQERNDALQNRD